MDHHISEFHLQKYDSIIKDIEKHFEENARLKKILENENNKIFLHKLKKNNMILKLSQVNVKIFRNLFELYTLYEKDISSYDSLKEYTNCKFYLIEIHLTKLLLKKLSNLNWSLFITIDHESSRSSKVINNVNKTCIVDVIPINEIILNCTLETDLIVYLENQIVRIRLDKTEVDIQYHFSSSSYTKNQLNRYQTFINITQLHNTGINFATFSFPMLDYELKYNGNVKEFVKTFIKDCYHSFDIEMLNELESMNKNKIEFTLYAGQQHKYSISFNKEMVKIRASYEDLFLLKKYFHNVLHSHEEHNDYGALNVIKVRG